MNKKEQRADTIQGRLTKSTKSIAISHRIFYSLFDTDHFYTV